MVRPPPPSAPSARCTASIAPACFEDLFRTLAESGLNFIEACCTTNHPMIRNRFVVEVGDTAALRACVGRLRNVESVFDAYRVTLAG